MINLLVTNTATGGAKKYTVDTLVWNEILPLLENTEGMKATLVRLGNQVYNVELTEKSILPPPVAGLGYVIAFTQSKMKGAAEIDFDYEEIDEMSYRELKLTLKELREDERFLPFIGNYTNDNVETLRIKLRMCYDTANERAEPSQFDLEAQVAQLRERVDFIEMYFAIPTDSTLANL